MVVCGGARPGVGVTDSSNGRMASHDARKRLPDLSPQFLIVVMFEDDIHEHFVGIAAGIVSQQCENVSADAMLDLVDRAQPGGV
jgi:hypothetical protein